jgi:hypothetical protein
MIKYIIIEKEETLESKSMGAKKDINRVRELIFGKDIERFEKKFKALEEVLDSIEIQQKIFEKDIRKQLNHMTDTLETLSDKQSQYTKDIQHQNTKTSLAFKEIDKQIQAESQRSLEQLKTLKTELKMYMKAKLNNMDNAKISHMQLSEMFATLANELKDVDDTQRHAQ